jgi:hypothetical protein
MKNKVFVALILAAAALILLNAQVGEAFHPLSDAHLTYGLSQYIVSEATGSMDGVYPFQLSNPTGETQMACVITYSQTKVHTTLPMRDAAVIDNGNGTVVNGCECAILEPHTNARFHGDFANLWGDGQETIIAPIRPVILDNGAPTFMADGLGMVPFNRWGSMSRLVHPSVFNLPINQLDRHIVNNCLCNAALSVRQRDMWEGFGVGGCRIDGDGQPE